MAQTWGSHHNIDTTPRFGRAIAPSHRKAKDDRIAQESALLLDRLVRQAVELTQGRIRAAGSSRL